MAGGWIHLITGCMFSGKTDEMLRLIRRAEIAGRRVVLVRPAMDDRTEAGAVESRSGVNRTAESVADSGGIPPLVTGARASVVAIDEAQFFDEGLPEIAELLDTSADRISHILPKLLKKGLVIKPSYGHPVFLQHPTQVPAL